MIFYPLNPDPWIHIFLRIQRIRIRILSTAKLYGFSSKPLKFIHTFQFLTILPLESFMVDSKQPLNINISNHQTFMGHHMTTSQSHHDCPKFELLLGCTLIKYLKLLFICPEMKQILSFFFLCCINA